MSNMKFVSHESFPEDQYIKEIVYLEVSAPARVAFVRKQAKNGGMFWGVLSAGVTKKGSKIYYKGYMQDSSFLEKDIEDFLEQRKWENKNDELPF